MVETLIILTGAVPGIRDLWWTPDSEAAGGYMPFRGETRTGPWVPLSPVPVPAERFRDQTFLSPVTHVVGPGDWISRGEHDYWAFRCPRAPIFGKVLDGRALMASLPEDVALTVDGRPVRAARVDGIDATVWLSRSFMFQGADPDAKPGITPQDDAVVEVTFQTLGNFVDPAPDHRAFYTVVPLRSDGTLAHEPGVVGDVVNAMEVDKMDWIEAEMVRRNAWEFENRSEPAHLLVRRTAGPLCGCVTNGAPRTGCTSCYETGFVGGYYGPFDFGFINPDQAAVVEIREGGRKVTRQSRSMLGPVPYVLSGDLIVRRNGERLVISNPLHLAPRGVLLQQEYDAVLLPPGDTRYRVPLRPPSAPPVVFDPAHQDSPGSSGEPIVAPRPLDDLSTPTPAWENSKVPVGRTVVFGNIQT